jgi:hypothetical protein
MAAVSFRLAVTEPIYEDIDVVPSSIARPCGQYRMHSSWRHPEAQGPFKYGRSDLVRHSRTLSSAYTHVLTYPRIMHGSSIEAGFIGINRTPVLPALSFVVLTSRNR